MLRVPYRAVARDHHHSQLTLSTLGPKHTEVPVYSELNIPSDPPLYGAPKTGSERIRFLARSAH